MFPSAPWRVVKTDGGIIRETQTDYDAAGRPVREWAASSSTGLVDRSHPEDPLLASGVLISGYDANGNKTSVTDSLGNTTRTAFDSRNRAYLTAVNPQTGNPGDPSGSASAGDQRIATVFDQAGNAVAVTDARGFTTITDYDRAGRVTRVVTPVVPVHGSADSALVSTTTYDPNGNVLTSTDAANSITRNAYDRANRLTASAVNPQTGNPADPTGPPGANDIVTRNDYDAESNLIRVTDGLGQVTEFTYDGLKRKTSVVWDANDSTRKKTDQIAVYDALLQVTTTDALGREKIHHYDSLHRPTGIECPAATAESRTFILDRAGRVTKVLHGGHTLPESTALTADSRHVGMGYDFLDRVLTETSAGITHTSTWDKGGNRLTITYGGTGRVLTSTYDKLGRLDTLSEKRPAESTPRLTGYDYDANGNVVAKTHANGTAESTTYDALNRRMVHQVVAGSTVLSSFTFSHDAQSNVARIVETYDTSSGIAGRTVTNTYDKTRRLLTETAVEPGKTVATTYGYDKANNRTSKIVATTPAGGSTTTETHGYVYGSISNGLNSNQVWKWIKPGGAEVVYTYDANGNRATRAETIGGALKTDTYTWDHWNRLTELDLQSKAAAHNGAYEYGYDHRTRRVVRDESAISGRSRDLVIYSGGTSVQEHEGESGATPANAAAPAMEYIRGSDWGGGVGGILYTARAGVVSWAHYNGRGDVVTRTSDTGSLTYAATYEAFGTRTQEAGTNPDRQRANTKEEDPTGLLNEGHRYRDLELGMFISRDQAGFVDGPNVYTYVVQNPWSAFDPEGLQSENTGFTVGHGGWVQTTRQPGFLGAAFPAHARAMNPSNMPMPSRTGDFRQDVARSRVLQTGLASGTAMTGTMFGLGVAAPVAGPTAVWGTYALANTALRNPEAAVGIAAGVAETVTGIDGPNSLPDFSDVSKATKATAELVEQAAGSSTARSVVEEVAQIYHRFESNEGIDSILESKKIFGHGHTFGGAGPSPFPAARGIPGPAPEGATGVIEFTTKVPPTSSKPGTLTGTQWIRGSPGVEDIDEETVAIPIEVVRAVKKDPAPESKK